MTFEYITAAPEHAQYEIIEDAEPHYGEVPELPGVSAPGRTLEECRRNPAGVIGERLIYGSGAGTRSPGCRPHRGRGHRGGYRCRPHRIGPLLWDTRLRADGPLNTHPALDV